MKNLHLPIIAVIAAILVFIFIIWIGTIHSSPEDLIPIVNSSYNESKAVFYPSTDYKVCAIVISKNGDVYYIRMNAYGTIKDEKRLFNINDYDSK